MTLREPWRTRLLLLSFAVNLVTIPLAARHVLREWTVAPIPPQGPPRPFVMMERLARELPPDDRSRFSAAVEPHLDSIEVARVQMEGARRTMLRSIAANPFDADAVSDAMRRWQKTWHTWSDELDAALLAGFKDVSATGREHLAEAGLHRRPR